MPSGYTHLTQEQRYEIEIMHRNKVSLRTIAANIGVSASTLSSELRRNKAKEAIGINKHNRNIKSATGDKAKPSNSKVSYSLL